MRRMLSVLMPSPAMAVAVAALLAACGGLAVAATSSKPALIRACASKKTGALRLASKCRHSERSLSWNKEGVPGLRGLTGATGATGAQGVAGKEGPQGKEGIPGSVLAYAHINGDGSIDTTNTSSNITSANITHISKDVYEFSGLSFTVHSVTVTLGFGVGVNDDAYGAVFGPHAAAVVTYNKDGEKVDDNFYIVFN